MIESLKDIFNKQRELQDVIKKNNPNFWDESKQPFEGYRIFMLANNIMHECMEFQRQTHFKYWKKDFKADVDARHEELMDIMHFFIQLCIEEGLTPQLLHKKYLEKLEENHKRQENNY